MYRIVFKYSGKEYTLWVTGDGEKVLSEEMPPVDSERQKVLEEKEKAKEVAVASIAAPKTGLLNLGKWVCLILGLPCSLLGLMATGGGAGGSAWILLLPGLILIAGAIIFGVFRYKKRKPYLAKKDEIGAQLQKEIDSFISQSKEVLEQFKKQKKGMRGIYEAEVTGDANAF